MTTIKRSKAFQAVAREPRKPLKAGQRRCPICFRGVKPTPSGLFYPHNASKGVPCDSRTVKAGYVYRGTGVDTLAVSA